MVIPSGQVHISPELQAAQALLLAKRAQLQQQRAQAQRPQAVANGRSPSAPSLSLPPTLPAHLGWHSMAVTAVLQRAAQAAGHVQQGAGDVGTETGATCKRQVIAPVCHPAWPAVNLAASTQTLKLYPDIAVAMLRREQAAAGRVWLLLRHLDVRGCGWLTEEAARQQLTEKHSPLRICGLRQWRNLLAQGEGVFWRRENGRIWLRSVTKVALSLGVVRLTGRPVALPLVALTQRIGLVRAHLYASFHSGRQKEQGTAPPISRTTLQRLTHVQPRAQRRYEQQARVQQQPNFAIGPRANQETVAETAWQHGTAVFPLTDHQGRQGKPGVTYVAWQLPNQYTGPHLPRPKGCQKRINRKLADLFMQGMTGNDAQPVAPILARRYFGNGKTAVRHALRQPNQMVYWPETSNGRCRVWHCVKRET